MPGEYCMLKYVECYFVDLLYRMTENDMENLTSLNRLQIIYPLGSKFKLKSIQSDY